MTVTVKHANTWKPVYDVRIKDSSQWKLVNEIWSKVGSDWKKLFYRAYADNIFIGGAHTNYGSNITTLFAATRSSTTIDHNFSPAIYDVSNNAQYIYCLLKDANTIYVGGVYATINGYSRHGIGAIDVGGSVLPFNIVSATTGYYYALAKSGNTLYMGGDLGSYPGYTNRAYTVAADVTNNSILPWDIIPGSSEKVYAMVADSDKGIIYVGGIITSLKSSTIYKYGLIAAELSGSGNIRSFDPGLYAADVRCIVLNKNNNTLYVGGDFTTALSYKVWNFAGTDKTTGLINKTFRPIVSNSVNCIIHDESNIYILGSMTTINGTARNGAGAIDKNSNLLPWDPNTNSYVNTAIKYNDKIYLGGIFTTIKSGAYSRAGVAAVESSGAGLIYAAFNPVISKTTGYRYDATFNVYCLGRKDTTLYFGGAFNKVNNEYIMNGVGVDIDTGTINSPDHLNSNYLIYTMTVGSTATYWGGMINITKINSQFASGIGLLTKDLNTYKFVADVNNSVNSVLKINANLYMGGVFTTINGSPRSYAGAIDISGTLLNWNPYPNGSVNTLSTYDNNTIYMGGTFSYVKNSTISRGYAAASDICGAGNITTWNPTLGNSVYVMTCGPTSVYIGGSFTTIKGVTRGYIGLVDMCGACNLLPWGPICNGGVRAILPSPTVVSPTAVYIGGDFTTVNSIARPYAASIDLCGSGALMQWYPNPNAAVYCLADDITSVYLGGNFTTIKGGTARYGVACVDISSAGNLVPWNLVLNGYVQGLSIDGSAIYIGGTFTSCISGAVTRFCAFDRQNNLILPNKDIAYADSTITGITYDSTGIYLLGSFSILGGVTRKGGGSIDFNGVATAWDPQFSSTVYSMVYDISSSYIYSSGLFTSLKSSGTSVAKNYFAEIESVSGYPTSKDFKVSGNTTYHDGLKKENNLLWICGSINSISGVSRQYAACMDISGNVQSFNPILNAQANCIDPDTSGVYIGGGFSTIIGKTRTKAAAFSLSGDAELLAWNPSFNSKVSCMALNTMGVYTSGADITGVIYCGGEFTTINSVSKNYFAAIDLSGGNFQNNFKTNYSSYVKCLTTTTSSVIIGGLFNKSVNGNNSSNAHLDEFDFYGNKTKLNYGISYTNIGGIGGVYSVIYDPTDRIYAGGYSIELSESINRGYFTNIEKQTTELSTTGLTFDNSVYTIAKDSNIIYIGGLFGLVNGVTRNRLASVQIASSGISGMLTAWNPDANGSVFSLTKTTSGIYVGGAFNALNTNKSRTYLGIVDNTIGALFTVFNPTLNGQVNCLTFDPSSNILYFGGTFTTINSKTRSYAAAVNGLTTVNDVITGGQLTVWDPYLNSVVNAMLFDNNIVYIGGQFSQSKNNTKAAPYVCSTDTCGACNILNWSPTINGYVWSFDKDDNHIYIGGEFTTSKSLANCKYCSRYSKSTSGALYDSAALDNTWIPRPNSYVKSLAVDNDYVFLGGDFTTMNNNEANAIRFACVDKGVGNINSNYDNGVNSFPSIVYIDKSTLSPSTNYGSSIFYIGATSTFKESFGYISPQSPTYFDYNYKSKLIQAVDSRGNKISWFKCPKLYPYMYGYDDGYETILNKEYSPSIDLIYPDPDSQTKIIYVGGLFKGGILAMDISGNNTSWDPKVTNLYQTTWEPITYCHMAGHNERIYSIIKNGNTIYFGGNFNAVSGSPRYNVAAVDISANLLSWNPGCYRTTTQDEVYFENYSPEYYFGINGSGNFEYETATRFRPISVAHINVIGGNVRALYKYNNDIYIGGDFNIVNGLSAQSSLVCVDSITGNRQYSYTFSSAVTASKMKAIDPSFSNYLIVMGTFNTTATDEQSNSVYYESFMTINMSGNRNLSNLFNVNLKNGLSRVSAYDFDTYNNVIYITGPFNSVNNVSNNYFASYDFSLSSWNSPYTASGYWYSYPPKHFVINNGRLYNAETTYNENQPFTTRFIGNASDLSGNSDRNWVPTYPNTMPFAVDTYAMSNSVPLLFNVITPYVIPDTSACPYSVLLTVITGSNKASSTNINTLSLKSTPSVTGGDIVTTIMSLPSGWTYKTSNTFVATNTSIISAFNFTNNVGTGYYTITATTSSTLYRIPNVQYINYYLYT